MPRVSAVTGRRVRISRVCGCVGADVLTVMAVSEAALAVERAVRRVARAVLSYPQALDGVYWQAVFVEAQRATLRGMLADTAAGCESVRQRLARAPCAPSEVLCEAAQMEAELSIMLEQDLSLKPGACAQIEFVDDRPYLDVAGARAFGSISGSATCAAHCTVAALTSSGSFGDGGGGGGGGRSGARSSGAEPHEALIVAALVVGAECSFILRAVDWRGAPCTVGGDPVSVELEFLERRRSMQQLSPAPWRARVVDNNDGTYTCAYTANVAGRARLHVTGCR